MRTVSTLVLIFIMSLSYGCSSTDFEGASSEGAKDKDADATDGPLNAKRDDGSDGGSDGGSDASDASDDAANDGGIDSDDGNDDADGSDSLGGSDDESSDSGDDDELQFSDGSVSGFKCPADLNDANGAWSGTWVGYGPEGVLSGTVSLTMKKRDKKSFDVSNYSIKGSYVGQPQSIQQVDNFNFILSCNDAQFPLTQVTWVDGKPYYVILRFTKQSWNPPSVGGIGLGGPVSSNPTPGGFGGWTLNKN